MYDYGFGPMPRQVDSATIEKLALAEVATIGHWRLWGFCDLGIRRLVSGPAIAGTAVTVSCPPGDNASLHYAIDRVRPGDIIVIERQGDRETACLGDVVAAAALHAGALGIVLDGPCTDVEGIRETGLSVWCRGVSGRTTRAGTRGGRINLPVSVGGVVIAPGDALLCDDSGVLALDPSEANAEASRAIERQSHTLETMRKIKDGAVLAELSGAKTTIEAAMSELAQRGI